MFPPQAGDRSQVVGGPAAHLLVAALARQLEQVGEALLGALQVAQLEGDRAHQVQRGHQVHGVVTRPELRLRGERQAEGALHVPQMYQRLGHEEGDLRIGGDVAVIQEGDPIPDGAPAPLRLESLELGLECRDLARRGVHGCNDYRPIASA